VSHWHTVNILILMVTDDKHTVWSTMEDNLIAEW
jgi:hypothetical protein